VEKTNGKPTLGIICTKAMAKINQKCGRKNKFEASLNYTFHFVIFFDWHGYENIGL